MVIETKFEVAAKRLDFWKPCKLAWSCRLRPPSPRFENLKRSTELFLWCSWKLPDFYIAVSAIWIVSVISVVSHVNHLKLMVGHHVNDWIQSWVEITWKCYILIILKFLSSHHHSSSDSEHHFHSDKRDKEVDRSRRELRQRCRDSVDKNFHKL